jgi:superfamily II DNA/RNA helicase
VLRDPIRISTPINTRDHNIYVTYIYIIVVGTIGQANPDIQQIVKVMNDPHMKWQWLVETIETDISDGKILIFVSSRADTEDLTSRLKTYFSHRHLDVALDCLHGDKSQEERSNVLKLFRLAKVHVLVATDVASRGLDVKDIRVVINYDVPRSIEV